ncbi:MAG: TonB-dependent receptor, partial [Pseudomonadota bacterium]
MIKQLRLLSIAVPTLLSGSVFAQIEEITVTAQRREASLQDVPASVTALSAEVMAEKQITNVRDLYSVVPNLDIATNTGTASAARIFLRGIGEDESRGAVDQAVAIYVDDVYIGRSVGSLLDLLDLDRVEVLRGPQGTLYGRNSNGGAIKLVSKRPDTERNAYDLGFTVGSDGRLDARGTANLALSDTTAIRASLMSRSRDGFHDLNPNGDFAGQGREVGESDVLGLRVALSSQLNDRWSLDLAIDHTQDDSDPIPDSRVPGADADNNIFTIEPEPGTSCSAATPLNFRPMGCFLDYSSEVETSGISATVSGDFGGFTFRSLTGYREMEDELATRIGSPFFQQTDQEQISQEFTLTSNGDGPFSWVTGLYFYDEDVQLDSTFIFDFTVRTETTAAAIFAQGTYAVNDALNLTAGIRYTDEDRDITSSNLSLDGGTGVFSAERSLDNSESTYTLSADYSFSESVMVYVSYATGFKSGGASADCFSPTACFLPVDNEEVGTWEIGLRSTLLDDMVSLNLTYFNN